MQKVRASFWIYVVGVSALGLFLGAFEVAARRAYGDWFVFGAVLAYLLALRLVGGYVERRGGRSE
jgi:hypothetical protein